MLNVESNGTSPLAAETTGLVSGKQSVKGLIAGLEPSAELLAIAMGAHASSGPIHFLMQVMALSC